MAFAGHDCSVSSLAALFCVLAEDCHKNIKLLQLSDLGRHCICFQEAEPGPMDCRSLVEEEAVDVNLRDAWDAVPLYYACRSGKPDIVICFYTK